MNCTNGSAQPNTSSAILHGHAERTNVNASCAYCALAEQHNVVDDFIELGPLVRPDGLAPLRDLIQAESPVKA